MISFTEAQNIINSHVRSFGTERLAIDDVLERALSETVYADRDYPPFNRSMMDGIAINLADFQNDIREFTIAETIYAGQESNVNITTGQCYKIMTGASVPLSANAVIRREDIVQDDKQVKVNSDRCNEFQNIARRGQDILASAKVLEPGQVCTPVIVSLLASLGRSHVWVEKLPKVSVITTGNEVVDLNDPVSPVQIRNSNSYLLKALLSEKLIKPAYCKHVRDEKEELYNALEEGLKIDILIINGGVSAGDADYVPEILESLHVKKLFHKVAIRPGKPFWCGIMPSGGMVFALPGNPYSCMTTFKLFIEPYLNLCQGMGMPEVLTFPLNVPRDKKVNLDEFFPVRLNGEPTMAEPLQINGSGDIRLGLKADMLALHPADRDGIKAGEYVECYKL